MTKKDEREILNKSEWEVKENKGIITAKKIKGKEIKMVLLKKKFDAAYVVKEVKKNKDMNNNDEK